MGDREPTALTKLELQIMQVIWKLGASSVNGAAASKTCRKRCAAARLHHRPDHAQHPRAQGQAQAQAARPRLRLQRAVTEAKASRHAVRDLVDRMFGGSADELVMSLIKSRQIDPKRIAELSTAARRGRRRRMNALLSSPVLSWLLSYLFNALWQIPLVFAAAWIAARMLRRADPARRASRLGRRAAASDRAARLQLSASHASGTRCSASPANDRRRQQSAVFASSSVPLQPPAAARAASVRPRSRPSSWPGSAACSTSPAASPGVFGRPAPSRAARLASRSPAKPHFAGPQHCRSTRNHRSATGDCRLATGNWAGHHRSAPRTCARAVRPFSKTSRQATSMPSSPTNSPTSAARLRQEPALRPRLAAHRLASGGVAHPRACSGKPRARL